ncbi:RNA polymerase subunit sigma-70 [Agromyces sp. MMS17-SY077]|uniref:RNA polymerase subunit sigma-70 n=1 Tax=Agromyces seonyuensis TaxID=2662446 RepID=A0A6I4P7E9_9MICO|nr:DUF6596 domain-containing protein [Agromyces seonyuensis]MWB99734.1 RNA polymerase subunit sigma-70 [Agromyces seonyuensis]
MTDAQAAAASAAEHAARSSYGRLVAILAAGTGDLALAEDALGDAFATALARWPESGVPENPEGWLIAVARNRRRDVWKSADVRRTEPLGDGEGRDGGRAGPEPAVDPFADLDPWRIPDRRLELLFACAHPAIDPEMRTPLMLQVVLGFEAARIARAYTVPAATMAQRLVRSKRRIARAGIPFALPDRRAMPERLDAVLEAIYGCAALTWRGDAASLAGEAAELALVTADLLGDEPEAWGLAARLTLGLAARRPGPYVPLDEQDPVGWDARRIDFGETLLGRAQARGAVPGRFQLEAAMYAVHLDRRRTGVLDLAALRTLAAALVSVAPSLGAEVALAAILGRAESPAAGLAALPAGGERFQSWQATRAELLARSGRRAEAAEAYDRAIALSDDDDVRVFLRGRRTELA